MPLAPTALTRGWKGSLTEIRGEQALFSIGVVAGWRMDEDEDRKRPRHDPTKPLGAAGKPCSAGWGMMLRSGYGWADLAFALYVPGGVIDKVETATLESIVACRHGIAGLGT
jgi:hypothetical protein